MKTCCNCFETKPLDQFHVHRNHKDGRTSKCKACVSLQDKQRVKDAKTYAYMKNGVAFFKHAKLATI